VHTLASLREARGLTQRQLAEELSRYNEEGIEFSASSIALYELGLRTPSLKRARLIAKFFGVSVEDIIFGPIACVSQANHHSKDKGDDAERKTSSCYR